MFQSCWLPSVAADDVTDTKTTNNFLRTHQKESRALLVKFVLMVALEGIVLKPLKWNKVIFFFNTLKAALINFLASRGQQSKLKTQHVTFDTVVMLMLANC